MTTSKFKSIALVLLFAATATFAPAQATFTTLVNFVGGGNDNQGVQPEGPLVQGLDGAFYGTATGGGINNRGTIFKVTSRGTLVSSSFLATDADNGGENPVSGAVQAVNGSFYGTTLRGGISDNGAVFEFSPKDGTITTLYSFCSLKNCADGNYLVAGLVQGGNGNLLGTTLEGGSGYGTIFEITPAGKFTTLYDFCTQINCADGSAPHSALIQASNGEFYGTTAGGGANGVGTVFKITAGSAPTVLYSFCSQAACADGSSPLAGVVEGSDGDFYGTTVAGGIYGDGTVFRITPAGMLTTLHSFDGTDGTNIARGLIQGTDGNFYGTAFAGGTDGDGTIFEITPAGDLTTLHNFDGDDGSQPLGELVQGTDGSFYGTTINGGANGSGTIFSLSVGLGPFVEMLPAFGKVEASVTILGTNLTGATGVTFNGAQATFTVVSNSEISTAVPVGATIGTVQVSTPAGTLSSNVSFQVRP